MSKRVMELIGMVLFLGPILACFVAVVWFVACDPMLRLLFGVGAAFVGCMYLGGWMLDKAAKP